MEKDDVNDIIGYSAILVMGATIGALTGLGLSFTALSPLVMGGIVAAVPIILLCVIVVSTSIAEGKSPKKDFFFAVCFCAASAAIGVGIAAATIDLFRN